MTIKELAIATLFSVIVTLFVFGAFTLIDNLVSVPQCHEDVVLVGVGDFENGRWDSYICGPAVDDYHD